jgi:hypothetical protein
VSIGKSLLGVAAEGVVEGIKSLVQWARERREKRERDLETWKDIQRRHVERRDNGK